MPPYSLVLSDLPAAAEELLVDRVVREIPGKRSACFARWKGAEVFAKLFTARFGRERHWKREERGVRAMLAHGIATPALLYSGGTADGATRVLIFERVAAARTALEAWNATNGRDEQRPLLARLSEVLARHHAAGLVQKDLHLKNFLVAEDQILTLDGADIIRRRAPLAKRASIERLGLLLAQLYPRDDDLAPEVYAGYARMRGWAAEDGDLQVLERAIKRRRARRKTAYLEKIFRECSAFVCRSDRRRFRVWDRRYDSGALRAVLADPDQVLGPGTALLKDGNTATVGVAAVDGRRLVIKRYNIKGVWHGVKRALRPTRAARAWRHAQLLRFYGIPTAVPVALLEKRLGPLRGVAYFIAEHVDGVSCREYFGSSAAPLEDKRVMAEKVAALLKALESVRLSHGDLKATNILLSSNEPVLVDLDAMREHRSDASFGPAHARDLERFLRNWEGNPDAARLFREQLSA